MDTLFSEVAPSFDQPLAVLKHCHDRIRKQLATLQKLIPHLAKHGSDDQAQQAASAVVRYFTLAAPLHHADEEDDLLPALQQLAANQDASQLNQLLPKILQQHQQMSELWQQLETQLNAIANPVTEFNSAQLDADLVQQFQALYDEHMHIEESHIAPMAKRLFSDTQMQEFGAAMQKRRNLA